MCVHACVHARTHTQTHIHTSTYIYIYIYAEVLSCAARQQNPMNRRGGPAREYSESPRDGDGRFTRAIQTVKPEHQPCLCVCSRARVLVCLRVMGAGRLPVKRGRVPFG